MPIVFGIGIVFIGFTNIWFSWVHNAIINMLSIGLNDNNVAQKCYLRYAYARIHQQLLLVYISFICFDFTPV